MKQRFNLALKNRKPDGVYNIAVRYYESGMERYIDTEFRATREDWEATSGRAFKEMEPVRATLLARINKVVDEIEAAGQEVSFDLFKSVWNGRKVSDERSWITLLDKYLEAKADSFKPGTKRIYNDTRVLLVKMARAGYDLSLARFQTEEDYNRLEKWFTKVGKIGRTSLAMHMQNIKAAARFGYDPRKKLKWISSDAFVYYQKPTRKVGTHPNTLDELKAIRNFDVSLLAGNRKKNAKAYQFGRDFWCWMVLCGGMEARSVALLKWPNVHKDYFTFERAKVEDSGGVDVVMSTNTEMTQYMFDTYGIKDNPHGYVFPFLQKEMTPIQQEIAITKLAKRITKNVQRIAKYLGITPLPSCKRTRPTFAVLSNELGMDIKEQQQMMGHKKISTTEIYMTHIPTRTKIAVSERFAEVLK